MSVMPDISPNPLEELVAASGFLTYRRGLRRGVSICSDSLDVNRAVLEQGDDRRDGCDDWCQDRADDSDGQRKLRDRAAVVFDDHAANVALTNDVLHLVHERRAFGFERFP